MTYQTKQYKNKTTDGERIVAAALKIEARVRSIRPFYRRQVRSQPHRTAEGSSLIWATVSRGLLYADPEAVSPIPTEGYSYYVLSLLDAADWASGQAVAVGDLRNNSSTKDTYVCTTAHTTATEPTLDSHTNWDFFKPRPTCQEHEGTTYPDMRMFSPWFQPTDEVPLIINEGVYYFAQQTTKICTGSTRSLMWNDTDHRLMAVFAD
jgi:hypothetical protein